MKEPKIKYQFKESDFDKLVDVFCNHINDNFELTDRKKLAEELVETGYSEVCIKFFLDAISAISEKDIMDEKKAKAVKLYVILRVNAMLSQYDMLNTCDF